MNIAYLRVSTKNQNIDSQKAEILKQHKIDRFFIDCASGGKKCIERPEFKNMFDFIRVGDTLIIYSIDRLGRNTLDVLNTINLLIEKEIKIISIRENFDLSSPLGKAILPIFATLSELERNSINTRRMAGIEQARSKGVTFGRKPSIDASKVLEWKKKNKASISNTAKQFNISISSVKRFMKKNILN